MKTTCRLWFLIAVVSASFLSLMPVAADEMNLVKVHVDSFPIVGIETRTTNAREMTADAVIGKMWARLSSENFLARIPNRIDSNVIALYSGYESDKDGPYNFLLGAKVSSAKDIPPGMVSRTVSPGDYAMFTAKGGPPPQMTFDLWKHIWSIEKPGQLHRAYKTDFEVHYGDLAAAPPETHIDIYIGVRK